MNYSMDFFTRWLLNPLLHSSCTYPEETLNHVLLQPMRNFSWGYYSTTSPILVLSFSLVNKKSHEILLS